MNDYGTDYATDTSTWSTVTTGDIRTAVQQTDYAQGLKGSYRALPLDELLHDLKERKHIKFLIVAGRREMSPRGQDELDAEIFEMEDERHRRIQAG